MARARRGRQMSLREHLVELRRRLMFAAATIVRGRRIALLAILLFAAVAVPSADVVLAAPIALFCLLAAAISWGHDRRLLRRGCELSAAYAA